MTSRQMAKARTRERVILAARNVFAASGYEGATIRAIASHANLSTGSIFSNFKDKAELYRVIFDHPPISTEAGHALLCAVKIAKSELIASGNWHATDQQWPVVRQAIEGALAEAEGAG